jgi:predicted amidohydrolase YtcJ
MLTKTVIRGARLGGSARVVDLLVGDGRVLAVGDLDNAAGIGDVVRADGRVVLPGLWDHHVHFDQWAQVRARLDLAGMGSAGAAARLIANQLAGGTPPTGSPLVGYGFRDALWPDTPNRELLDGAGHHPVVLISADLHSAWLNTSALALFGEPDHPTGLLREDDAMRVIGEVGEQVGDAWAADAARAAAARGVVGIVDMEKPWPLGAWQRRIAAGGRSLRVVSSVWPERLDDLVALGLRTGDVIEGSAGLLTAGSLKVIADGSLNTRTAFCNDPYPDLGCGLLLIPFSDLAALMRRATNAGLTCAIHAIGDHANSLALQAFSLSGAHGTIEHAQLLDDDDVRRFAELGVVASVQPEHALDDRDVADRYWAGRTQRAFALRSLLDAGAVLAFGSDAPVAPLDPWIAIAASMHRSRDGRPRWHPEQEITLTEALAASMSPAGREPTLRAGDPADLIVLDGDPFTATPDGVRTMPVAATMVAGDWIHRTGL